MKQFNEPDMVPTKVVAATEGDPMCVCANCGAENRESELGDIKNYSMRVDAGEVIPAGECPEDDCCGALCHYVDESLHEIEEEDDEDDDEEDELEPSYTFTVTAQQRATILAALRFYGDKGQGDPDNRTAVIHAIATASDRVISLDRDGIRSLAVDLDV